MNNEINSEQSGENCRMTSAGLFSLIGGAGLGALLMYMFDPEEGKSRRAHLAELAEEAYHKSGDALESTWETLREKGSEYGKASYEALSGLGSTVSDEASHFSDHAADLTDRIKSSRYGKRIGRSVSGLSDEASKRARYLIHGSENHGLEHGWSQAIAAAGCVALGFGAMYLLDPVDGARRRNTLRDKFLSTFNQLGHGIDGLTRNLFNRASGTVHEARARLSRDEVSDHVLEDRIRAAIGHVTSSAHGIGVEAGSGTITLTGDLPENEIDAVLKAVWSTRGVTELVNRLNSGGVIRQGPSTGAKAGLSTAGGSDCGCSSVSNLPRDGSTANVPMGAPAPSPAQM
jgi:hypothetical protein